jgi:hypothetical protein
MLDKVNVTVHVHVHVDKSDTLQQVKPDSHATPCKPNLMPIYPCKGVF